ncbi:sensor histidine kinase [Flavobacterium xinjiangense]|uniref:histidine kinase n=1 Tax=Flavobacterium xinjiangense TaxID=178356 RepID=A0A1M7GXG5_9FLAO|nr:sensor histidine kinase [Flavobacterium xinjiangense]SHM21084.1 His Kinase A (phospho-acceptor) domain-containing protein [Flavobacterium xinjiangense]
MKFLKLFKNSQVFKLALGVAILVVCYFGSKFFSQMQKLTSTLELIAKSNDTQLELEKLLSIINSYDYSLRNYIITNDESYLQNRFLNRGIIEEGIKKLKVLTVNDPLRKKDILTLEKLINYRFKLFRETLIAAKSNNVDQLGLKLKLKRSNDYTEMMKLFVYKVINSERLKAKFQNSNHQFELQDSLMTAFLLIILSLLILLLSFNKTNIDIEALKEANDKLKLLNESFNTAEKTAGFGHWMVNLETNTYTFSDNLYRLMGVEPNAFEPNLENTIKYFHPDDLEYVTKVHRESLINHQSTSIVFRFLTATNEVRYIMGVGSFTKDGNGDLIKIGVNYDITNQYKKTLELEENNKELKYINTELESFNNIVSHDLQEPLRKIQMFISRLEEKEFDVLSQQGRDYFSKVRVAANRMQTLLIDLVNYSRTVKGDKVFVETDLNKMITETLIDLSINVEEKNAVIQIGKLPTIKAIPFQIKQLFINLVSNSLNYSQETQIPKISITSEIITEEEASEYKIINKEDYYKIVVADNGIGFKQEYAEKIFLLFKRLETDPKYSGTGLGLAICSRIVDNHNGFIWAKSQPNEGAKFSIFLPKVDMV